jgi:hypothetical protein
MRDGTVRGLLRSMERSVPRPSAVRHLAAGWTRSGERVCSGASRSSPRQFRTKATAHRPIIRQSRSDRMRGGSPAGRAGPFPTGVGKELSQTDLAVPGRCVLCTVTTSCWPRALADNIKPAGALSIAKGSIALSRKRRAESSPEGLFRAAERALGLGQDRSDGADRFTGTMHWPAPRPLGQNQIRSAWPAGHTGRPAAVRQATASSILPRRPAVGRADRAVTDSDLSR